MGGPCSLRLFMYTITFNDFFLTSTAGGWIKNFTDCKQIIITTTLKYGHEVPQKKGGNYYNMNLALVQGGKLDTHNNFIPIALIKP